MRMYKVLKENQNNIVRLNKLSPNRQIPQGVLAGASNDIEKENASFNSAKAADAVHEAMPGHDNQNKAKGKVVFFRKNMDTQKDQQPKDQQNTNNLLKMNITKEYSAYPKK
eukprot:853924_1